MIKWFKVKKGEDWVFYDVKDVFAGKHLDDLPFPMSYLKMIADERPWTGKPHVTDLINGPRLTYLKSVADYAVDPDDGSFRVMGIQAHKKLDGIGDTSEILLEDDDVIGRTDLLEENGNGTYTLTDYKISGSYKVAKALGIYKKSVEVLDKDGKPVIYKSGEKEGQVRTRQQIFFDPAKADTKDWSRQLNVYKYLIEKQLDIVVTKLQIFIIVRDGNTVNSSNNGVDRQTYLVPIKIYPADKVQEWIKKRSEELMAAFTTHNPRECDAEESWEGRRCKDFCEVRSVCEAMGCSWLKRPERLDSQSSPSSSDPSSSSS